MAISRLVLFRRAVLVVVAVALTLAAIIGVWYAEEDYRGTYQWKESRRRLEARGESLDAAHFIPPAIPDDRNLAMAPLFVRLYRYEVDPVTKLLTYGKDISAATDFAGSMPFGGSKEKPLKGKASSNWVTARPLDLALLQQFYRQRKDFAHSATPQSPGENVLLALNRFDGALAEIARDAAERPLMRSPINWTQSPAWGIRLPQYSLFQQINQTLRLRACAELSVGRTDDAFRDVLLGLRLSDDISHERMLIAHLVAITCLTVQLQPIWDGLSSRRWSSGQLAELQQRLQSIDLLRDYKEATRTERAVSVVTSLNLLRKLGASNFINNESTSAAEKTLSRATPGGWADLAVALTCERMQTDVIDCVDPAAHRIFARRMEERSRDLEALKPTPISVFAKIILPVDSSIASKTAQSQSAVDEAAASCALERYYLDHHAYPDNLEALAPNYVSRVPPDVIDGAPLRYARTSDDRYRLWAVGWDGQDSGGTLAWKEVAELKTDDKHGDWVWQYQPLSPP